MCPTSSFPLFVFVPTLSAFQSRLWWTVWLSALFQASVFSDGSNDSGVAVFETLPMEEDRNLLWTPVISCVCLCWCGQSFAACNYISLTWTWKLFPSVAINILNLLELQHKRTNSVCTRDMSQPSPAPGAEGNSSYNVGCGRGAIGMAYLYVYIYIVFVSEGPNTSDWKQVFGTNAPWNLREQFATPNLHARNVCTSLHFLSVQCLQHATDLQVVKVNETFQSSEEAAFLTVPKFFGCRVWGAHATGKSLREMWSLLRM